MLLRWIFTVILIYMIYRFVVRLFGGAQRRTTGQKPPRFNSGQSQNGPTRSRNNKNLDQIEDAEFEDITEKEKG
ncbi:MAG: hypothetical protein R6V27_15150 [Balneolaceae bacterium]